MGFLNSSGTKVERNRLFVTNNEGSTLPPGTPVYIKSRSNNEILIGMSDADIAATMPAIGITTRSMKVGESADILLGGFIDEIELGGLTTATVGQTLYVSQTGTLTNVEPAAGTVQSIGTILEVNAAGDTATEALIAFGGAGAGGGGGPVPLQDVLDEGNEAEGTNASISLYNDATQTEQAVINPGFASLMANDGAGNTSSFAFSSSGISSTTALYGTSQNLTFTPLQQFTYNWNNSSIAVQFKAEDNGFTYQLATSTPFLGHLKLNETNGLDVLYNTATLKFDDTDGLQINNPATTGYKLPLTDGTAGQVLTTDGSGAITFEDAPSPVGVDLALNTRDAAYTTTGHHEGTVLSIGSTALTAGTVYMWDGTQWNTANAGAVATADGLMGVATATATGPDVLVSGIIYMSATGSVGDPLYLDTTTGALNATAPSASTQIVRVMGYKLDANRVYFNPSNDWLEIV